MNYLKISAITLSIALTACAHTPTAGDKMSGAAQQSTQLGNQWNNGESMILDGRKLIAKGNDNIAKGNQLNSDGQKRINSGEDMVENGKSKIAQGEVLEHNSEEIFNSKFPQHTGNKS
jgi:hypothetical protein